MTAPFVRVPGDSLPHDRNPFRHPCWIQTFTPSAIPRQLLAVLMEFLTGTPVPLWVFTLVSTLGRIPGTWVLSAQGARTAAGNYLEVILLTALALAVALPLYYYRDRIIGWFRG